MYILLGHYSYNILFFCTFLISDSIRLAMRCHLIFRSLVGYEPRPVSSGNSTFNVKDGVKLLFDILVTPFFDASNTIRYMYLTILERCVIQAITIYSYRICTKISRIVKLLIIFIY